MFIGSSVIGLQTCDGKGSAKPCKGWHAGGGRIHFARSGGCNETPLRGRYRVSAGAFSESACES